MGDYSCIRVDMAPKAAPKLTGTELVHGDDELVHGREVAASISVTTTFRAPLPPDNTPLNLDNMDLRNPERHVYSRYTQDVSTRAERVLSKINGGFALTYASGLAASYAALVHFHPKRIAITGGYHGCHNTIEVYKRSRGGDLPLIGLDDDYQPGDLCWLETPLNPTGEARDIKYYAEKAHAAGAKMLVDSTFAPPPLQYPFKWGADMVMHSGTKYFGGHSDLLCGVLVVPTEAEWKTLWTQRTFLGSMMGSLESWLLLRSLRTLHLRVPRQSENAKGLARWLSQAAGGRAFDGIPAGVIDTVWHSSLQGKDSRGFEPSAQLEGGWNPTFAILLKNPEYARLLPHSLEFFVPATSLGGVESLIEQRSTVDPGADPRLVRISCGVEDLEDMKTDLRRAFQAIVKPKARL
ncbi:cystathionine gamma-synthase [Rhodofomes roseus]|uniref:Cystathionine gamma-synthase n=1 Tax=Rhodofomes roseus TaxID=34475 RepID=A0ABQ8KZM2_9APHY|nr:cystathionine gamma-synthase [Rhodofomes roseus]KAH9843892.1 cystathionine gamma-synthase [Rhodofomes roseus]